MQKLFNRSKEKINPGQTKTFHSFASVFALALIAFIVGDLYWNLMMPRMDFYNELWGPAYLLVRGQSPYDTASLNPNLPAAWLPMAIGFFFPLGWLPEVSALQVWYILAIVELCLIIYIAQGDGRSVYATAALALLCFFFPPTLNHINLGQFSITAVLCWVLAAYLLDKKRDWLAALCIALALSKPHLGFLAALGLSYRYYLLGGIRAMFLLWGKAGAMILLLCLPLFAAYPNWIPDAIVSMSKNGYWAFPSLYVLYQRYFGAYGYALWGLTVLAVLGLNFLLWKKLPTKNAVYWSIALTPLAIPYVGSWDFVVLFPLLISTFVNADWRRKAFLLGMYCAAWYWMALIQMLDVSHNHYFWWVPLWFLAAFALTTNWKK